MTDMFALCPVCEAVEQVTLVNDWQARVEAGAAIDIVGCGNPWHYNGLGIPGVLAVYPEPELVPDILPDGTITTLEEPDAQ